MAGDGVPPFVNDKGNAGPFSGWGKEQDGSLFWLKKNQQQLGPPVGSYFDVVDRSPWGNRTILEWKKMCMQVATKLVSSFSGIPTVGDQRLDFALQNAGKASPRHSVLG